MSVSKFFWMIGAVFFLILGVIGILFPIIPQVPFLIIALFCLSKGAPRIHRWIRKQPLYQKYVLPLEQKVHQLKSQSGFLKKIFQRFHH